MKKNIHTNDRWSEIAFQIGINEPDGSDSEKNLDSAAIEETTAEKETIAENQLPETITNSSINSSINSPDMSEETIACSKPDSFTKEPQKEKTETENIAEDVLPFSKKQETKQETKKRFFERFPKINLFGTSPKEPLESVIEGAKSPSLIGKSFTSNKLEKVPVFSDRTTQQEKEITLVNTENVFPNIEKSPEKTICTEEHTQAIVNILDPWSKIASQVGALSVSQSQSNTDSSDSAGQLPDSSATVEIDKNTEQFGNSNRDISRDANHDANRDSNRDFNKRARFAHDKKRSFRELPSMFDEPTPESEESTVLKNLMETEHYDTDAEKRLRFIFSEEEKEDLALFGEVGAREQNDNYSEKQREEYYDHSDDYSETFSWSLDIEKEQSFTPNDGYSEKAESEEKPRELVRERGRRGARFEQREEKPERYVTKSDNEGNRSETTSYLESNEMAWDIEEEPKFTEHSYNKQRKGRNTEKNSSTRNYRSLSEETTDVFETKAISSEENDLVQLHKNIPSWDEAIYHLIESNIARHFQLASSRNNGGRR
ncbi:MAG: hypothetical protein LBC20_05315 [Planctomycetaceae bacterium]|jgi:hypothetical protein|nr:hypothetical protein [Planctomycetaceae bacterium]